MDAHVSPEGTLDFLSKREILKLRDASEGGLYDLFQRCALAVLNSGSKTDNTKEVLEQHQDFEIRLVPQAFGVKLEVRNAPDSAFVDGRMIRGIRNHLFAVLRDILYVSNQREQRLFDLDSQEGTTEFVYHILRNAGVLRNPERLNLVVCWGGHSINPVEYTYTKEVGYHLGLRGFNICTGCGPGAMKGPMKGAAVGHAKQCSEDGRYVGLTEPGIIAAESPNALVNALVILPDIEKRLEAFVRLGHAFIVFPGGAGTTEEILYLAGILLHPENAGLPFPIIFTGPKESAAYFEQIDYFLGGILGHQVRKLYRIIIGQPAEVARSIQAHVAAVQNHRRDSGDAFYFNWMLKIDRALQEPFHPTHANMADLPLNENLPPHELATNLRRLFSGIVAGNVKDEGIRAVEQNGPFLLNGQQRLLSMLDRLLSAFCEQQRMKLPGHAEYQPCYRLVA